jgi:hypothetical protein
MPELPRRRRMANLDLRDRAGALREVAAVQRWFPASLMRSLLFRAVSGHGDIEDAPGQGDYERGGSGDATRVDCFRRRVARRSRRASAARVLVFPQTRSPDHSRRAISSY